MNRTARNPLPHRRSTPTAVVLTAPITLVLAAALTGCSAHSRIPDGTGALAHIPTSENISAPTCSAVQNAQTIVFALPGQLADTAHPTARTASIARLAALAPNLPDAARPVTADLITTLRDTNPATAAAATVKTFGVLRILDQLNRAGCHHH